MKNQRRFFLGTLLLLAAAGFGLYRNAALFSTWLVRKAVQKAGAEYLDGQVRLKYAGIDRSLKFKLKGLEGRLKSGESSVPFEIGKIESHGPVTRLFSKEGLEFTVSGIKPLHSEKEGAHGSLKLRAGKEWFSQFQIEIAGLGLEDVRWMDPVNLEGASGLMAGKISFYSNYKEDLRFESDLSVRPPGGFLQAKFFEALRPYLPGMPQIIVEAGKPSLVGFQDASLVMRLAEPDRIKGSFHIRVPEYNLNLNLNLEVRIDQAGAFSKLCRMMGNVKVKL